MIFLFPRSSKCDMLSKLFHNNLLYSLNIVCTVQQILNYRQSGWIVKLKPYDIGLLLVLLIFSIL